MLVKVRIKVIGSVTCGSSGVRGLLELGKVKEVSWKRVGGQEFRMLEIAVRQASCDK